MSWTFCTHFKVILCAICRYSKRLNTFVMNTFCTVRPLAPKKILLCIWCAREKETGKQIEGETKRVFQIRKWQVVDGIGIQFCLCNRNDLLRLWSTSIGNHWMWCDRCIERKRWTILRQPFQCLFSFSTEVSPICFPK